MKHEIFVVNAIKNSERSFLAVSGRIRAYNKDELLDTLRDSQKRHQYALEFNINDNDIFEFLAALIKTSLSKQPPVRFTRRHFQLLRDQEVKRMLADILKVPPNEFLQTLFDVEKIRNTVKTLEEFLNISHPIATSSLRDAERLIQYLSQDQIAEELETMFNTSSNDWQRIFERGKWIPELAKNAFLSRDLPDAENNIVKELARLIDAQIIVQEQSQTGKSHRNIIGPLGLIAILRRLAGIQLRLHKQIVENCEYAAYNLPGLDIVSLLKGHINLYGLGFIGKGIQDLVIRPQALREFFSEDEIVPDVIDEGKIMPDIPFSFAIAQPYKLAGQEVCNIDIGCLTKKGPQVILHARKVPLWVAQFLSKDVQTLTPARIHANVGDSLSEKLLNSNFPLLDENTLLLRTLIMKLSKSESIIGESNQNQEEGPEFEDKEMKQIFKKFLIKKTERQSAGWRPAPEFVQAIALSCGNPLSTTIPELWPEEFVKKLPYEDLPVHEDPEYHFTVADIERYLENKYHSQGIHVFTAEDRTSDNTTSAKE